MTTQSPKSEDHGDLRALAEHHGLKQIGVRPSIGVYLKELWRFRQFASYLASSRAYAKNQNNYLGQLWAVLTPVLNAAVYVIIFGFILGTDRGVENVIGFIVIGVFLFRFFDRSVMVGGKSISERTQLVRSLHFPRAVMPISAVLTELATLLPAIGVMCAIVLLSGLMPQYPTVHITWEWLGLPVLLVLLLMFNLGCAMIMARIVAHAPDVMNVIPFLMRFAMYGSGVLFSIEHYLGNWPAIAAVMQYQPVALAIDLGRQALLEEPDIPWDPTKWLWMLGWSIVFLVGGFLYFWHAEERYGRD